MRPFDDPEAEFRVLVGDDGQHLPCGILPRSLRVAIGPSHRAQGGATTAPWTNIGLTRALGALLPPSNARRIELDK